VTEVKVNFAILSPTNPQSNLRRPRRKGPIGSDDSQVQAVDAECYVMLDAESQFIYRLCL